MNKAAIFLIAVLSIGAVLSVPADKIRKPSCGVSDGDDKNAADAKPDVVKTDDMKCELCLDFVQGLESAIATEEGTIEELAGKVCDTLTTTGSTADDLCKQFVDYFIKEIESAIKNSEPPRKICTDIVPICSPQ